MTDTFRALCAELVDAWLKGDDIVGAMNRARAALGEADEPAVPAPPADGEVAELTGQLIEAANGAAAMGWDQHARSILRAAELLQRLSPPQPVPVSERLPGPEDCDAEGRCWWGRSESHDWSADWTFATYKAVAEFCEFSPRTTWLPAHALPLPEVGE